MINNKRDLEEYLAADRNALYPNGAHFLTRIKDPIFHFQVLLRKCEYYRNTRKKPYFSPVYLIYKNRLRRLALKLGFSIPENCFGKGLSIAHYGSIVINPNVKIGENCRIHVGVNIGANKDAFDVPLIGNNVYIGPGAKIFGKIKIGDNVRIGANAVVISDVENDVTVVGIPANVVSRR